jgi:hypothetical protein
LSVNGDRKPIWPRGFIWPKIQTAAYTSTSSIGKLRIMLSSSAIKEGMFSRRESMLPLSPSTFLERRSLKKLWDAFFMSPKFVSRVVSS